YYRGIVKGEYSSLAALSFFDGNVMGVISSPKLGNIVIGKSKDQKDFVVYADQNLLGKDPFVCGVENMDYNIQKMQDQYFQNAAAPPLNDDKCVKLYYEVAHDIFLSFDSDVRNTLDFITGIQNNIGALYADQMVTLALNSVKVWT